MSLRIQVTCPECGSVGANGGPCKCHICDYNVLMLPSTNGEIDSNWLEFYRAKKIPLPKHPWLDNYLDVGIRKRFQHEEN